MARKFLLWGLLLSLLSVVLGAFGAHALKQWITADKLVIFEIGVRYQFMHASVLILLAIYSQQSYPTSTLENPLKWVARFFLLGMLFFSGSLYLLTFQSLCSFPYARFVGPITPLGGLFFMLGWGTWIRLVWLRKVDK
jgi:uncharacterized membrane protein YgdD (TMEM256/DUF423 family)